MTKGKITTGRGQAGLHAYIFGKPDAERISGSCAQNDFLCAVAALRCARPDVKQSAIHIAISATPGERLDSDQWDKAGFILRVEMDMLELEYQQARHNDTDLDHCHFEFCKIKPDGSLWNDSHSARRLHRACERIERELGLKITLTVEEHRAQRKAGTAHKPMSDGSLREFQRTGQPNNKTKEAIARRIANEHKTADRAAHQSPISNNGRLDELTPKNPGIVQSPDRKNTDSGREADPKNTDFGKEDSRFGSQADRSIQPIHQIAHEDEDAGGWLESTATSTRKTFPPSLNGRLENRTVPGRPDEYNLYWPRCDRPTFRWHSDSQQIQLVAKPTPANVAAVLDIALSQGMKPPLQCFGSLNFQKMMIDESLRRGIPIRTDNDHADLYMREQQKRLADERAADAARAEEDRATAEKIRIEKICQQEDAERKNRPSQHMHMKPPSPPSPTGAPENE